MTRFHVLSGIGLAFGAASIAQGQQCSSDSAAEYAAITPVQYCPEETCETDKYPRFRTFLRRMSWKHNTTHSHFMYESCPPYWQPAFGYHETGWRRGEALPPPCPTGCPPVGVPVCPPGAVSEPYLRADEPVTPIAPTAPGTVAPPSAPPVHRNAAPEPMPTPAPLPNAPPEPKAPVQPKPSVPQGTEASVSPRSSAPASTRANQAPRRPVTRESRPTPFEKALAGSVTHEIFPVAGAQADAFPLRPLPAAAQSATPVSTVGYKSEKRSAQPVDQVNFDKLEFVPLPVPAGSALGLAVTTGEFVMKSIANRRQQP